MVKSFTANVAELQGRGGGGAETELADTGAENFPSDENLKPQLQEGSQAEAGELQMA